MNREISNLLEMDSLFSLHLETGVKTLEFYLQEERSEDSVREKTVCFDAMFYWANQDCH